MNSAQPDHTPRPPDPVRTSTYRLINIGQAVEVGTTLSQSWFRGHSACFNELTPGIFRGPYNDVLRNAFRPDLEATIIDAFKRRAPGLANGTPAPEDHLSWLFWMQHHGVRTRLLDWTRNVLVALYFAVSDNRDRDGEVWAMYNLPLNSRSGIPGLPFARSEHLQFLAQQPLTTNDAWLAGKLGLKDVPRYPLAFLPTVFFPRMVLQQCAFTIHPKPTRGNTIPALLTDSKELVRYIIPASCKHRLLRELCSLGISRATLFPDLDSLAETIHFEEQIISYAPPAPPECEGPVQAE